MRADPKRRAASAAQARPSGEARALRPIEPVSLAAGPTSPAIAPAELAGQTPPRIEWVAPRSLYVEEEYQRQLSRKSLTLIRNIVAGWNWAHVKPPICARAEGGRLCVIDGQHTAIAAVTHGGIETLPVVVVEPGAVDRRAAAFIAHNRDRLHLTPMQMHYAALAAGEQEARSVNAACLIAGAHICRVQPKGWKPGDTVAVAAIAALVKAAGVDGAAEVLVVLVDAARAPIKADEIKAAAALLHDRARPVETAALAPIVKSESGEVWARLAASLAAERGIRAWQAMAHLWRAQLSGEPVRRAAPESLLARIARTLPDNSGPAALRPRAHRANGGDGSPPPRLPRIEAEVMRALAKGPADIATLAARTEYAGSAVASALKALRYDGAVVENGGIYRGAR